MNEHDLKALMDIIIEDTEDIINYQKPKKKKKKKTDVEDVKESSFEEVVFNINALSREISANKVAEKPVPTFINVIRVFFNIVLITGLIFLGTSLMTANQNESRYINIKGYSVFYIRTNSMVPLYNPGSMIVVKQIDSAEIQVGDDITYYDSKKTQDLITHRVTLKLDAYENQGRVFQTKGINNENPDKDLVSEDNVIGIVVLTLPIVGTIMNFIQNNLVLVIVFLVLLGLFLKIMTDYYYDYKFSKRLKKLKKSKD